MRAKRAEVVQSLADVRLFSRCTAGELKTVARHVELVSFDPGDVLMEKGDPGDALFLVLAGEAEVTDGRRQLGRLGPGDHVGELALLDRAPRGATVTVVAPLDAAVLGIRMFRTLLREFPSISEQLLAALAADLRTARGAPA